MPQTKKALQDMLHAACSLEKRVSPQLIPSSSTAAAQHKELLLGYFGNLWKLTGTCLICLPLTSAPGDLPSCSCIFPWGFTIS